MPYTSRLRVTSATGAHLVITKGPIDAAIFAYQCHTDYELEAGGHVRAPGSLWPRVTHHAHDGVCVYGMAVFVYVCVTRVCVCMFVRVQGIMRSPSAPRTTVPWAGREALAVRAGTGTEGD